MEINLKSIQQFINSLNKFTRQTFFQFIPNKDKYHSFYGDQLSQSILMY